ncbi:MAG: tetratricopeptide repeat protein [Chitinispirillales bacterium]|jgi:tetratricopeptide (TPR) repeat protein|nr:tetratricopeptide repeat protein [Chitinispirillales bacterium]
MKTQTYLLAAILMLSVSFGAEAAKKGKNAKVEPQQTSVLEQRQYSVEELKILADQYRNSNDLTGLSEVLSAWSAMEPRRFDLRLELGNVMSTQGKSAEAIKTLKEASAIIPSDEAPHRFMAQVYNQLGNDSLRHFHLLQAAALSQRSWQNQLQLALYYVSKGMNAKAEPLLINAIKINSSCAVAKFEYGKIMLTNGDAENAFRKFSEAVLLNSDNPHYQAFHAYSASLTNRHRIAAGEIAAALKNAPKDPQALYLSAMIHNVNGETAAAEKALRSALSYSPADFQSMEALADLLVTEMKFKEACKYYLTVMEKAGANGQITYKLGKALALDMKFKEAVIFLESAAAKNPDNSENLYGLVDIYCTMDNLKQAAATLARFASAKSIAWYQAAQGRIYEAQNNPELAWIAYLTSHKFNQENPHVNAGFARILTNRNEYDSAMVFFNLAYSQDPVNMRILIDQAKAYEKMGSQESAVEIYEKVAAIYPEYPEIHMTIAVKKSEAGDYKAAVKYLTQGLEIYPKDSKMHFMLGQMYQACNHHESAVTAYQASLKQRGGSNIEALRMIGHIYYSKLTNEKKAKDFFKRYVKAGGKNNEVEEIMKKLNSKEKV